jgi:ADP-ribose pyrophosphatase YjhB (NUDIX family)
MEQKILQTFLYNHKLKFNQIEKLLKERSNKLAYHLNNLKNKGILTKTKETYQLSPSAEPIIPHITKKQSPLPVILITLKNKNNIFLHKRNKRPFKDLLGLPGGRIIEGETIAQATRRIMKEKFNINCNFKNINSISLEQVSKKENINHSFLLILVTATTKDNLTYSDIKNNKNKIIKSDYKILTNDLNKEIKIKNINWKLN